MGLKLSGNRSWRAYHDILWPTARLYFGDGEFDWFQWMMSFFSKALIIPVFWPLHAIGQALSLTCFFALAQLSNINVLSPGNRFISTAIELFWLCSMCNFSVFIYERLMWEDFNSRQALNQSNAELMAEKERSEVLLLNVLPDSIAQSRKKNHC